MNGCKKKKRTSVVSRFLPMRGWYRIETMAGSKNGYGMYIFFNMAWPKFRHQHSRNQTLLPSHWCQNPAPKSPLTCVEYLWAINRIQSLQMTLSENDVYHCIPPLTATVFHLGNDDWPRDLGLLYFQTNPNDQVFVLDKVNTFELPQFHHLPQWIPVVSPVSPAVAPRAPWYPQRVCRSVRVKTWTWLPPVAADHLERSPNQWRSSMYPRCTIHCRVFFMMPSLFTFHFGRIKLAKDQVFYVILW